MATTQTMHLVDCPTAIALAAPTATSASLPNARKHKCIYNTTPLPAQVRVTSTTQTVPPKAP